MVLAGYFLLVIFSNYFSISLEMKKNRLNFPFLLQSNFKKITNRKYPAGTIMNSNYDSVYKKLPENIYLLGVPNILSEPDLGRL